MITLSKEEQARVKREAKQLLEYFVSSLQTIPRLSSWYLRNMKHCKDLVTAYTLGECKEMVKNIFEDSFWKDKLDGLGPIIKAPHKWLPPEKEEKAIKSATINNLQEIEQHIWYEIFKGDPLDNRGITTEDNIQEAITRLAKGESLENIYKELESRVR